MIPIDDLKVTHFGIRSNYGLNRFLDGITSLSEVFLFHQKLAVAVTTR